MIYLFRPPENFPTGRFWHDLTMSALPRRSRLWTEEQVRFVLKDITTVKRHKHIAAIFNEIYASVNTIQTDHIKYNKAQYGNRLDDGEKPVDMPSDLPWNDWPWSFRLVRRCRQRT
jgi:hypothetical protein